MYLRYVACSGKRGPGPGSPHDKDRWWACCSSLPNAPSNKGEGYNSLKKVNLPSQDVCQPARTDVGLLIPSLIVHVTCLFVIVRNINSIWDENALTSKQTIILAEGRCYPHHQTIKTTGGCSRCRYVRTFRNPFNMSRGPGSGSKGERIRENFNAREVVKAASRLATPNVHCTFAASNKRQALEWWILRDRP